MLGYCAHWRFCNYSPFMPDPEPDPGLRPKVDPNLNPEPDSEPNPNTVHYNIHTTFLKYNIFDMVRLLYNTN